MRAVVQLVGEALAVARAGRHHAGRGRGARAEGAQRRRLLLERGLAPRRACRPRASAHALRAADGPRAARLALRIANFQQ